MKNKTSKTILLALFLSSSLLAEDSKASTSHVQNENDPNLEAMLLGNESYEPKTWMEKGRVLYLGEHYIQAIQAFFKATRLDSENSSTWFNLGMSYYQNHQYDESLISFIEANRLKRDQKYIYHVCLSYFKTGQIRQSIRYSRQLLALTPDHGYSWKLLAQSYEHLEQFSEAKTAYLKAQSLLPNDGEIVYALEQLTSISAVDLLMPNSHKTENSIQLTEKPNFVGKLPKSKLFSETTLEAVAPTQHGLPPLAESYHITFDAPSKSKFKPSEEHSWQPKAKTNAVNAKIESILEDL